jgi:transketolase
MGGLGACIAEEAAAIRPLPICRIGVQDRFSAYCGTWDYLLKEHQIDLFSVQNRVQEFVNHLPSSSSDTFDTA